MIGSVFKGIPLPTIYLYKRVDTTTGFIAYDVIDGKQRIEALLFFACTGPLAKIDDLDWLKFKGQLDGDETPRWRCWHDLEPRSRREFKGTRIPVIEVEGEMSEVTELFVSINSTGKKLTGQERRHAFYENSNVLRVATNLAENHRDELEAMGVFSKTQTQRMLHIEFTTELLLYAHLGYHMNKKTKLDRVIAGDFLIESKDLTEASNQVRRALRSVQAILPVLKSTRFHRRADFYTLVTLLIQFKSEGKIVNAYPSQRNQLAGWLLTEFGLGVDQVSERSSHGQSVPAGLRKQTEYLMTVKEGTDSAGQRTKRAKIMKSVLEGVFESTDPTRAFNAQQRRILWNASQTKACACCGEVIKTWEDMEADHMTPYINGGPTQLQNGAIMHKACNRKKGAGEC